MAQTYPIRGIGVGGINEDVPASELGLEFFNYAENVYVQDKRLKNVPNLNQAIDGTYGNIQWFSFLFDEETREPVIVYVTRDTLGEDRIKALTNLSDTDISRTSGYSDISNQPYARWDGFVSNSQVILVNGADSPQYLGLNATQFVDLPGWNVNWSCKTIQPFRGVWIALNINDATQPAGEEKQSTVVRWSSPIADYGSPPLYWDVLDSNGIPTGAGFNVLGDTPGSIVTGRTLKDAFLIYKTDSVVRMDYTGSDSVPFTFRTIFEDTGAWGPHSICTIRNEHFVVGNNDVYITDGFQKRSVISSKVKDVFEKLVFSSTVAYDVMVTPHFTNEEVYVFIRTKNSNGLLTTQMLTYNYAQDQWFYRKFPQGGSISYAALAAVALADPKAMDKWDDVDSMTWDEGEEVVEDQWDNFEDVPSSNYVMLASDGVFYTYAPYRNSISGQDCLIQKYDMDFGEVAGTLSDRIKRVLRMYPIVDPESKGYIIVTLWGHDRPGQIVDESLKRWYLFDTNKDHKIDVSVSGRYISMEIRTDKNLRTNWDNYTFLNNPTKPPFNPDNLMSLTGIDLDLVAMQRR